MTQRASAHRERLSELVVAASGGDREALQTLAREFEGEAFGSAYSAYPKPDRARVAGQYALGQTLRSLDRLRDPALFGAYLRKAARNAAIQLRRSDSRYRHLEDFPEPLAHRLISGGRVAASPEQTIWQAQVRDRVLEAVARLPERQRLAFSYVVLEGLSYGEAAREMGCESRTVGSQLFRARERLRKMLGDLLQ